MQHLLGFVRSLTGRIILTAALAVTAATLLITGLTWRTLDREVAETLHNDSRWSLRVAAEAFISYYPNYELVYDAKGEVQRLVGPAIPDFTDNEAVDRVSKINKGTATVFRFDAAKNDFIRLSTSVKRADGSRAVGTVLGNTGVVFPVIMKGDVFIGQANILNVPYQTGYMPITDKSGKPSGILFVGVGKIHELRAVTDGLYRDLLIASSLALLLSIIGAAAVSRGLMAPLPRLAALTGDLAAERPVAELPYQDKRDEIGLLARSLSTLKASVEERNRLRDQDLSDKQAQIDRAKVISESVARFRQSVSQITARLSEGSSQMDSASRLLGDVVSSTAKGADGAKSAANQTSQGISMVATSADQLNGSIREVASRAEEAARIVSSAVEAGRVSQTGISEFAASAERIGAAVTVIQAIAEQTNLLALNATIEAARAGDAGRGFAVVASEVKSLATQTGKATEDIALQIGQIQSASAGVVKSFEAIFAALTEIDLASGAIAASVEEQGAATSEIARSAGHAAEGAEEMSRNVISVEEMASKASETVSILDSTAEAFRNDAKELVESLEIFLKKVA
jgi:methyl-accepting chemotaxis protein